MFQVYSNQKKAGVTILRDILEVKVKGVSTGEEKHYPMVKFPFIRYKELMYPVTQV